MATNVTPAKENEIRNTLVESKIVPPMEIVWRNVIIAIVFHIAALYGLYLAVTSAMWKTILFGFFVGVLAALGITAGVHRLWSHRSYKAKLPLRIFLALICCIADEGSIYHWSRNHRVHHKYSDTDADPHNSNRGFFFSHIGWLLVRKHPEVIKKGKEIDLSDLLADPVVRLQKKYYKWMVILLCFVLPTVTPTLLWEENLITSFMVATVLRYMCVYHQTLCINSVAHMWGNRPYDQYIKPRNNIWTVLVTFGEGFHNYHHAFPWDYAASEYSLGYSLTTAFIDLMAWLGLAYDLRTTSPQIVRERKKRTGPGEKTDVWTK